MVWHATAEHEDLLRWTPRSGSSLCGRTPELRPQAQELSEYNPIGFDVTPSPRAFDLSPRGIFWELRSQ